MILFFYIWISCGFIATLIVLKQEYKFIQREKIGYSVTGAILMTILGCFSLYGVYLDWRAKKKGPPLKFYVQDKVLVCIGDFDQQKCFHGEVINTEHITRSYLVKYSENNVLQKKWIHEEKISRIGEF